jgi:hypothetical protein
VASNRPIFVLGCPRSGTTLLRRVLRAHPRVAIPPETRLLLDAYEHRDAYGDLRDLANRRALAEWVVAGAGTRFGGLGLDAREIAAEIVAGPPTLGSALEITRRAYARRLGKARWGDKRPGYVQHIGALLRMFPNAQFVHLVRDGRDCVAALKRTPWWRMGVYHAIATWTQAIDAGRMAARRLPSGTYVEVQYERLVADPATELRRLCGFLGEEYVPGMGEAARPGEPAGERLERWELALCEAVMADRLAAYGYRPSASDRPLARHLARYATVAAHRRLAAHKRAMLDLRLRTAESQPLASVLGRECLPAAVKESAGR